jgi:hypothetical protein
MIKRGFSDGAAARSGARIAQDIIEYGEYPLGQEGRS